MTRGRKELIELTQVNSRSFSAKLDCSSSANKRLSSVGSIHITKTNVAQIIWSSKLNTLLSWVFASLVLKTYS